MSDETLQMEYNGYNINITPHYAAWGIVQWHYSAIRSSDGHTLISTGPFWKAIDAYRDGIQTIDKANGS